MSDLVGIIPGLVAAAIGVHIYRGSRIPPPRDVRTIVRPSILRRELIIIRCDGCMAYIYTETDRGHIVGTYKTDSMIEMYLCERANGSYFSAIVDRCQGPRHGADVSERLGEDANGKIIEFT